MNFLIHSIQGGKDGYMILNEAYHRGGPYIAYRSFLAGVDYWTPYNPDARFRSGEESRMYGSGNYQQRNFIRLQHISLAYNINKQIAQKFGVDDLKVYLTGKDLITISNWLDGSRNRTRV